VGSKLRRASGATNLRMEQDGNLKRCAISVITCGLFDQEVCGAKCIIHSEFHVRRYYAQTIRHEVFWQNTLLRNAWVPSIDQRDRGHDT
jgi:hypothetical protein